MRPPQARLSFKHVIIKPGAEKIQICQHCPIDVFAVQPEHVRPGSASFFPAPPYSEKMVITDPRRAINELVMPLGRKIAQNAYQKISALNIFLPQVPIADDPGRFFVHSGPEMRFANPELRHFEHGVAWRRPVSFGDQERIRIALISDAAKPLLVTEYIAGRVSVLALMIEKQ